MFEYLPFSLVDAPGACSIVFSRGCNLYCKYCHNTHLRDNNQGLSYKDILEKIESIQDINPSNTKYNKVDWLIISGGEPFPCRTYPAGDPESILDFLFLAKRQGLKTGIYTNGLSPDFHKAIKLKLFDFINIDFKHHTLRGLELDEINFFPDYLSQLMNTIQLAYDSFNFYDTEYLHINTVICRSFHKKKDLKIMRNALEDVIPGIRILLKRNFNEKLSWVLTPFNGENPTFGNLPSSETLSEEETKNLLI